MAKAHAYDVAEFLDNPEIIAAYLNEAFESGDVAFIAEAIGDVARAQSMTQIAGATGLARESLYVSLSARGNPGLETIMKVLDTMGMQLAAKPKIPNHAQ